MEFESNINGTIPVLGKTVLESRIYWYFSRRGVMV